MSDEVEVGGQELAKVSADALYSDEEIDVFVDDRAVPTSDQSKLIDELKAKQAELQSKVDPVEAMKTAIQGLSSSLNPKAAPPEVRVMPTGVADWNAYKENFNTKVFEDPFQMVTDLVSKANEMQSASVANQNLAYSKRIVQIDPATAGYYKRWADEVEQEVSRLPVSVRASNPNVYEDALRTVKASHLDELIAEGLSAAQKSVATPPASSVGTRPSAYSEAGIATPMATSQPGPKKAVRVSESKMREITSYAEEWGIPEEAAIRLFQKRGML